MPLILFSTHNYRCDQQRILDKGWNTIVAFIWGSRSFLSNFLEWARVPYKSNQCSNLCPVLAVIKTYSILLYKLMRKIWVVRLRYEVWDLKVKFLIKLVQAREQSIWARAQDSDSGLKAFSHIMNTKFFKRFIKFWLEIFFIDLYILYIKFHYMNSSQELKFKSIICGLFLWF